MAALGYNNNFPSFQFINYINICSLTNSYAAFNPLNKKYQIDETYFIRKSLTGMKPQDFLSCL
jgi:hypothetical protein